MKKQQKFATVEILKDKVSKAKSMVLTDYRGLTHKQLEEIKKAMKAIGAEFIITKNTLLKISLPTTNYQLPDTSLEGPTATLFSYKDEIAPLSALAKFIKNFGLIKIKTGILNNKILSNEEVLKIAALPSRDILMATVVARLKSPIYGLHYSLNYNLQKLALVLKAASEKKGVSS
ncbi:MAG: 50S ribosomal protein L10 [Candidatus Gottesmanbacteria bacterium]